MGDIFMDIVCLVEEQVPSLCWVLKSEHHKLSGICLGMGKASTSSR